VPGRSTSVHVEDADGVRTITIDRPEARNAIDLATATLLAEAMDGLDADDTLRLGVLTGAGRGFSAGMDLKAFGRGEDPFVPGRGFGGFTERQPRKPLVAAVEGFALAGGFEMVLACDLVVASRGARLGLPEVTRGLLAAGGGLVRLPARIPRNVAMELVLTGAPITAERAHDLGLVNVLCEEGEALGAARALAATIARNAPLAVRESARIVREAQDRPESEAFDRHRGVVRSVAASADASEGASAFVEKRSPVWTGR
jgi:enoyl-CoA hydratase